MRRVLREPPPAERERVYSREAELRKLDTELARQTQECEQRARSVARERQTLESTSPLARLRRGERAGLKRALPWSERRLADARERLRALKSRQERLIQDGAAQAAWETRQELAAMRARAVTAELRARQPGRLAELEHAPPAEVIMVLGERPEGLRDRAAWQQAASALEQLHDRYGSAHVASGEASDAAEVRDRLWAS